mmetsp:Transcript_20776/g.55480  ORF Transcript_20776/g.55480 Transcript_20776/m.55480 type:complete len:117 (+) Transcript_20776:74-424(+)
MDIEGAEAEIIPAMKEAGVLGLVDEMQIEFHDWQRNKYSAKVKDGLHGMLEGAGLVYEYATFDMDLWRMLEVENKSFPQTTGRKWPRGWMDAHYFRKDTPWRLFPPCIECQKYSGP